MKFNVTCVGLIWVILVSLFPVHAEESTTHEAVQGKACYSFGDEETPMMAKKKAEALARERAVSGYRVWVASSSKVKNFQLQEDLIQTISAGMLHKVVIDEEEWEGRQICIALSAEIDPQDIDMEVSRRQDQQEIQSEVTSESFTPDPAFGLRIWLNKADGRFVEGEYLVIKVQADRDAYLKLDYFQANGTVVHLVPNLFRGQAFIQKGETYVFGGEDSPERFIISEPFGDEVIKAVASAQPFIEALTPKENVSESHAYVKTLKKGLSVQPGFKSTKRGIRIMSGASASLYTSSREVLDFKKTLDK
ncbi:MAG: DUF4384 domain-containing protein [Nitrospirota bacterium]|nr:DUF4384 domain-containing protein [Nitrospirota bacterium]MDH5588132.1 DUF4384 domain-containing protein [Nitrospirota bacterium]